MDPRWGRKEPPMGKNLKGREIGEGLYQRKSDGLYEAKYRARDGKRIVRYFKSLPQAKKWLAEAKYGDEHSCLADPRKLSVDSWFWYWLDEIKGDRIRYGTKNAYIKRYTGRIQPVIGEMLLSDVKPLHCQMVLNEAEKIGDKTGSVRKLRVIMRECFESAKDNEMIPSNPISSSVTYIKDEKEERRVLTVQEQSLLLDTAKDHPYYPIFALALQTGMRVGELQGLKWQDIDFAAGTIDIKRSLEYRKETKMFHENPPKSKAGVRTVPLTAESIRILKGVKENSKNLPKIVPYSGFVFLNRNGKPSHRGSYNRTLRDMAKKAGMESLSMHTLRHSFATRCIESGMRPKTLQKILGHATLNLTMDLYVHVTDDTLKSEMEKFEYFQKNA